MASANGEIANVIKRKRSWFCAHADDDSEFVDIVKLFLNNEERYNMGKNAKKILC